MENSVLQHRLQVAQNIEKSCTEGIEIQKARSGVYSDNATNRKLNRVGQQYGGKKQPEQESGGKGNPKGDDEPNHAEHAKKASTEALKRAAADENADEKVRNAAKAELDKRGEGGDDKKIERLKTLLETTEHGGASQSTRDEWKKQLDELEKKRGEGGGGKNEKGGKLRSRSEMTSEEKEEFEELMADLPPAGNSYDIVKKWLEDRGFDTSSGDSKSKSGKDKSKV